MADEHKTLSFEDLTEAERGLVFRHLYEGLGKKQIPLAQELGLSQGQISKYVRFGDIDGDSSRYHTPLIKWWGENPEIIDRSLREVWRRRQTRVNWAALYERTMQLGSIFKSNDPPFDKATAASDLMDELLRAVRTELTTKRSGEK